MPSAIQKAIHSIDKLDAPITPGEPGASSLSLDNIYVYRVPKYLTINGNTTGSLVMLTCPPGRIYIVVAASVLSNSAAAIGYSVVQSVQGGIYAATSGCNTATGVNTPATCLFGISLPMIISPGEKLNLYDASHQAGHNHNFWCKYYEVDL